MISYIVLSKKISIKEAKIIKVNHNMECRENNDFYTKEYKKEGISKLGVWIDSNKDIGTIDVANCTLNATIRVQKFMLDGELDIDAVLAIVNKITSRDIVDDREWKLQNVMFEFNLSMPYSTEYIELLNYRALEDKGGLKKHVDKNIKPSELYVEGNGVKINIVKAMDNTEIKCTLWLGKNRITDLPDSVGVKNRSFQEYKGRLGAIEKYLWIHYFKKLFGIGDFYSYSKAVEKVENSGFSKIDKENMISVLRGVAYYKGVGKYLNHIMIGDIPNKISGKVRARSTAERYISMLQRERLQINPVTIGKGILEKNRDTIVDEKIPGPISIV